MQVQGAAIQSSMDVGNGSDHAQPLPAVPFCASTASTTASSLAVLPTAAASDSGQGLVQGSEIRLTSRNAPSGVPIAPLPRTMKKEELEKLGGHSIREFRKYLLTHWHCTNCKCVWHGIPTTSTLFHLEWHTIPKFIASSAETTPISTNLCFHILLLDNISSISSILVENWSANK